MTFTGFPIPKQNYSKLPHSFIDLLPSFNSMAELKVVIYLLRHTWGYSEFGQTKKITIDEFMNGRKLKDGSRMDQGTGLSNNSVITGLKRAIDHKYILVEIDDHDKARIKKYYALNMHASYADLDPSYANLAHLGHADSAQPGAESAHRSEKEAIRKETKAKKTVVVIKPARKKRPVGKSDRSKPKPATTTFLPDSKIKNPFYKQNLITCAQLGITQPKADEIANLMPLTGVIVDPRFIRQHVETLGAGETIGLAINRMIGGEAPRDFKPGAVARVLTHSASKDPAVDQGEMKEFRRYSADEWINGAQS
jgi:hypothetical protein